MQWESKPYAPASPGEGIDTGIVLIHQEMRLLPDLTIAENVFVGRLPNRGGFVDREAMNRRAEEQLHRLGLDIAPTTLVRTLRVAAQQQVEIAKALTLKAKLLILDEPTAALGGEETERLFAQIDQLRKQGVSFIYISHRLEEIARIADRVAVLRDGRLVATHPTAQVPVHVLLENMVGRSVDRIFPKTEKPEEKEVLRVDGLTSPDGSFTDVSFAVHAGEIFGIAGIVGAGRTELVRAITGADPISSGSIEIDGRPVQIKSPSDCDQRGACAGPRRPQRRKVSYLSHTVATNLALGNFDRLATNGLISPRKVQSFRQGSHQASRREGQSRSTGPLSLRRQSAKSHYCPLDFARARRSSFSMNQPAESIWAHGPPSTKQSPLWPSPGMAVVVVSSDLEEVMGLSHRVLVLARGRNMGILEGPQITNVAIMELATA